MINHELNEEITELSKNSTIKFISAKVKELENKYREDMRMIKFNISLKIAEFHVINTRNRSLKLERQIEVLELYLIYFDLSSFKRKILKKI